MSARAHLACRVDMLTGDKVPAKYFQALSEADNLCAELDGLRELQCRVQELTAERNDLSERLASLTEASEYTLGLLADAKRELRTVRDERDRARNERDTYRAAVSK